MGDVRKQIIELIESYMDKTLNEGCLIKFSFGNNGIYDGYIYKIRNSELYFNTVYLTKNGKSIYSADGYEPTRYYHKLGRDYKIIGHYDITAVLKYIRNKKHLIYIEFLNEGDEQIYIRYHIDNSEDNIGEIFLLNKPLQLYSEQEEKDLLDLLLKIK